MQAAQRLMRPVLPKRFYTAATAEQTGGTASVRLDGRQVRTPGKAVLTLPTLALAEAIAAEWQAQGDRIDPDTMPLTRIANSVIDGILGREASIAADLARYAGSDLLCYRAGHPQRLVARQSELWDPLIGWAAADLGCSLTIVQGVMPVTQPAASLERMAAILGRTDAWRLAALHTLTTLTGSVLLALAHASGRLDGQSTWRLAHVDEDWQLEQWGEDLEAAARRVRRHAEFDAASRLLGLLRPVGDTC